MSGSLKDLERRVRKSKDKIHHLDFPDNVRHRVTMYLGSSGPEGLHHCFLEIVHNAIDEYAAGHCDRINVIFHADGSVSVADNGRGIPHEKHSSAGVSQIELALTKLHAGSKFFQHGDKFSSGLNGVGASCVNAVSTWFEARVKRGGNVYRQRYTRGVADAAVRKARASFPFGSGTCIQFLPDDDIFETVEFDVAKLVEILDDLAFLNPGLKIRFKVEASDEYEAAEEVYHHLNGLQDYLEWITEERSHLHVRNPFTLESSGEFKDRHDKTFRYKVEAVLGFVEEDVLDVRSFTNNVRTTEGGTHEDGFVGGVGRAVRKFARDHDMIRGVKQLKAADVTSGGVCGVLSFYMHEPRFASQTKRKLTNAEAKAALDKIAYDHMLQFLEENPGPAKAIVKRAILSAKKRERIEDIREVKKSDSTAIAGKLSDCITRNLADREIWLVEGDSAGGSAKLGRDSRTQAILPLRGKIINVEKASLRKMATHEEVNAIRAAIGTGIGHSNDYSEFDLEARNYDRIIIATDADADGGHISVLLLTFFFRFMRPLLERGHVFVAQPPLYGITLKKGGRKRYFMSDKDLEDFLAKREQNGKDNSKLDVQRYKGLGEMNPQQLWDTTMNPETRTLCRIKVEDAARASQLISLLMGSDVEARRDFIIEHALAVQLDI